MDSSGILGVMDDPDDQHNVIFHNVENPVAAMGETADALPKFFSGLSGKRILPQLVKRLVEPAHIGIGSVFAKMSGTIGVNFRQIGASGRTDRNLSHAARGVRQ
jgi:hypothetical protein